MGGHSTASSRPRRPLVPVPNVERAAHHPPVAKTTASTTRAMDSSCCPTAAATRVSSLLISFRIPTVDCWSIFSGLGVGLFSQQHRTTRLSKRAGMRRILSGSAFLLPWVHAEG